MGMHARNVQGRNNGRHAWDRDQESSVACGFFMESEPIVATTPCYSPHHACMEKDEGIVGRTLDSSCAPQCA